MSTSLVKLEDDINRAQASITDTAYEQQAWGRFYRPECLCLNNCTKEESVTSRSYRNAACCLSGPSNHRLGGY